MDSPSSSSLSSSAVCHVVAVPYPGRGHINPMFTLCKILASKCSRLLITFVITEEWLSLLDRGTHTPQNLVFTTIPNVFPSESNRGKDFLGFFEAVSTKMQAPFEQLLDGCQTPSLILFDAGLYWVVDVGSARKVHVASFWPRSSSVLLRRLSRLGNEGEHKPQALPLEMRVPEAETPYQSGDFVARNHGRFWRMFASVTKAQYVLLSSIDELEREAFEALKARFRIPMFTVGPVIPYFQLQLEPSPLPGAQEDDYLSWLDSQPNESVLYVSLGSYLSIPRSKIDEFAAGLQGSNIGFLWAARDESSRLKELCGGRGMVVPWCDQLRVLSHPSVGGFWSHCGWNSVMEGIFVGVPFLTYPLALDQDNNSDMIVDDWQIGRRVSGDIAPLVCDFMDPEIDESREMRRRAKSIQRICHEAIGKDGSSEANIRAFIGDLLQDRGTFSLG